MAYFLNRDEPVGRNPVGGKNMGGRPPPAPSPFGLPDSGQCPSSPLSRFVQEGYAPQGGMARGPSAKNLSPGFDANVAQQWNDNVQHTSAVHQQQNDPNFVDRKLKNPSTRVAQRPGGNSSLSLGWDEQPSGGAGDPVRRGRGQGMQQPSHSIGGAAIGFGQEPEQQMPAYGRQQYGQEYGASNARAQNCAGVRGSSREPGGGMAGVFGDGPASGPSSRGSQRAPSIGNGYGRGSSPSPVSMPSGMQHGGRQAEATGLVFGGRCENGSSNAYANGGNQNCGNGITDRRTTRVLQAPGGNSQICFG